MVSKQVLSNNKIGEQADDTLTAIAHEEDLNGLIRRNVLDTRRAVSFLMRSKFLNKQQLDDAQQILRDIDSLDGHTAFIFDKINFLMDATVGFHQQQPEQEREAADGAERRVHAAQRAGRYRRHVGILDDDAGNSLADLLYAFHGCAGDHRMADLPPAALLRAAREISLK